MKLHLSPVLALPLDAVTEKLGFLGRTGGGKTYSALLLAEQMLAAKAQIVALDPVGKWWSLRLAADGVSPGISVPVFGGLHGDVPLEPSAGKLVADVVCDRGISVVIDVSQFESDADKARFAEAFVSRFFYRKKSAPSAVHLFLEEAQEFIPQNPQREEARMLHAFTRIWKLGRNFGIGGSLLSQRPQEINKKVLNQTELLFCFQTTGPQERKAIDGWIAEKGIDEDISGELPKLGRGYAHAWSPAWLSISKVVAFGKRWTYDASSTPKVGERADARELAPIDLEKLRSDMAATIERAKGDDPKELRKRIASLEAELRKKTPAAATLDHGAIDRAIKQALGARDREFATRTRKIAVGLAEIAQILTRGADIVGSARAKLPALGELVSGGPPAIAMSPNGNGHATPVAVAIPRPTPVRALPARRSAQAEPCNISRTQQRMLDAVAFFESVGQEAPSRAAVAGFCAISHTTGSFANNLSALRTAGLIEDRSGGAVSLTDAGRDVANADIPPSLTKLHEAWARRLSGTQAAMLSVLIGAHPDAITRDSLAEALNIKSDTGSFANNLSKLRTLGLLEDRSRTEVAATTLLFPDGIAQ